MKTILAVVRVGSTVGKGIEADREDRRLGLKLFIKSEKMLVAVSAHVVVHPVFWWMNSADHYAIKLPIHTV